MSDQQHGVVRTDPKYSHIAGDWAHLPNEPCRFRCPPGHVYFLIDNGPEGISGHQIMRCDSCKRDWRAGSAMA